MKKTGDGTGRVTATGLDCGGTCSAKFKYGKLERFTVVPDRGSLFGGWGGICAADRTRVAPFRSARSRSFVRVSSRTRRRARLSTEHVVCDRVLDPARLGRLQR